MYKGYVKDWNRLKKDCFDFDNGFDKIRLLNEWDNFLKFKSSRRSKFFEVPLEVFNN